MEYAEDDYLMISGIQHFKFCRRQWALIHIEQQWEENAHTVTGELMHKKVHDPSLKEKRKDMIIARALPVASRKLGISGECDLVEFHKSEEGIQLHDIEDCIRYTLWSTKKENQNYQKKTNCSLRRKPCVWKKCFVRKFQKSYLLRGDEKA